METLKTVGKVAYSIVVIGTGVISIISIMAGIKGYSKWF